MTKRFKSNLDEALTRRGLRTASKPASDRIEKSEKRERNAIQPGQRRKKPELPRRTGTR